MSKANAVAIKETNLPAFVSNIAIKGNGTGNEKVRAGDLQIPRLSLLQDLSPEVSERKPEFITGAKPGMILNKLTGELFESMFVINLRFDFAWTAWKKRKLGGGLFGTFTTEEEAVNALEAEGMDLGHYDLVESPTHYVLLLDDDGKPTMPAIIDMPVTKAKVSRNWNSLIAKQGDEYDRFAWVWLLESKFEENNNAQGYFNYGVKLLGAAPEELFEEAKRFHEQVKNS